MLIFWMLKKKSALCACNQGPPGRHLSTAGWTFSSSSAPNPTFLNPAPHVFTPRPYPQNLPAEILVAHYYQFKIPSFIFKIKMCYNSFGWYFHLWVFKEFLVFASFPHVSQVCVTPEIWFASMWSCISLNRPSFPQTLQIRVNISLTFPCPILCG